MIRFTPLLLLVFMLTGCAQTSVPVLVPLTTSYKAELIAEQALTACMVQDEYTLAKLGMASTEAQRFLEAMPRPTEPLTLTYVEDGLSGTRYMRTYHVPTEGYVYPVKVRFWYTEDDDSDPRLDTFELLITPNPNTSGG